MSELDLKCIETLVIQAAENHIEHEEKQGKTRSGKKNQGESTDGKAEIPKLTLVMFRELAKQLLEFQQNKFNDERENFEIEIKKRDDKITTLEEKANELRYQIDITGQQNRKDNLKIVGVPYTDGEDTTKVVKDLAEHIGVEVTDGDLSTAHRIHIKEDKEDNTQTTASGKPKRIPSVIAKWVRRDIKTKVFEHRRQITAKPGCKWPEAAIYEDVTPLRSRILYELRNRKDSEENKKYKYVWSREGRMYCRTEQEAAMEPQPKPKVVNRAEDLLKLGWTEQEVENILWSKRH